MGYNIPQNITQTPASMTVVRDTWYIPKDHIGNMISPIGISHGTRNFRVFHGIYSVPGTYYVPR